MIEFIIGFSLGFSICLGTIYIILHSFKIEEVKT